MAPDALSEVPDAAPAGVLPVGPVWIERLSRQGDVLQRYRCSGDEIRIGRGYDVDVVIDDPLIDAVHLAIRRDAAGALIAEDLGSVNGLYLARGTLRQAALPLDGEQAIRIGGTWLRVREPGHGVAQARLAVRTRHRWPLLVVLAVAVLGLSLLRLWLGQTVEPKLSYYLTQPLLVVAGMLVWTAAWSIASRIFSGEARFERHLGIAMVWFLLSDLMSQGLDYFGFALTLPLLGTFAYVGQWLLAGVVCFRHLRGVGMRATWLPAGILAVLTLAAVGVHSLQRWEPPANLDQQRYVKRLFPPSLRLAPGEPESALFADADRLRRKLDRDRRKEPSGDGADGDDD